MNVVEFFHGLECIVNDDLVSLDGLFCPYVDNILSTKISVLTHSLNLPIHDYMEKKKQPLILSCANIQSSTFSQLYKKKSTIN